MGGQGFVCKLCMTFAFSMVIITVLILKIPYTKFFALYYLLAFVPFFFGGIIFAVVFDRFTEHSGRLYCASLMGSSVGCLAIVLTLGLFGGVKAALLIGSISAIAPIPFALSSGRKSLMISSIIGFVILSAIFGVNLSKNFLSEVENISPDKELFASLNSPKLKASVTRTYWSAYARTDLVEIESLPDEKIIFNDGGAGMSMFRLNGENSDNLKHLVEDPAFLPFLFGEKDKVLIIGAGGGKDVLIALMNDAKEVTAVEVNPDIVRIVREESEFNGGIYYHKNVKWVTAEGRNFVRRSNEEYDVIMLTFIWTNSAREIVGYSLTENYIYTVEAFIDYIDHLSEDGKLIIVLHNEPEVIKVFSTVVAALSRKNHQYPDLSSYQATRHIISFTDSVAHPHRYGFIVKKSPFSEKETIDIHEAAHLRGFRPLYFPYIHEGPMFKDLIEGQISLDAWVSTVVFNAAPTTDDSPFFYNYEEKGVPSSLSYLLYTVIFLTFIMALMASLFMKPEGWRAGGPEIQEAGNPESRKTGGLASRFSGFLDFSGSFKFAIYFLILGLGFMFVEIAMIQKFILFLGQPTLTFSALLFSLLTGSGIGSFFSGYIKKDLSRKVFFVCLLIAAIIVAYIFMLPFVFSRFLGHNLIVRLVLLATFMMPLGFVMGIPFPIGLRIVKRSFERGIAWAWGINGVASVLGSILAIAIAISSGFAIVLALGAFAYICVALIAYRAKFRSSDHIRYEIGNTRQEI
jgi:spermidine synthase